MSVLDELGALMPSRIWIVAFASLAGSLTPTFCSTGSATEYAAQVTYRNRMVKNAAGREVISGCQVILGGAPIIDPRSKIVLSTEDTYSTQTQVLSPPILTSSRYQDGSGGYVTELFL